MKKVGDLCPYCKIPLSEQTLFLKKLAKQENARNSSIKAKKNGNRKGGRNKKRDDILIKSLRESGLTIRAIAKQSGVSTTAVQRSLKAGLKSGSRLEGL